MRKPLLAVFAAIALVGSPRRALSQSDADKTPARAPFRQAQQALTEKDYAGAADLFGRSDALVHAPTASLGIARAQAGLGKLVAAYETYTRIVREGLPPSASPAFVRAVDD